MRITDRLPILPQCSDPAQQYAPREEHHGMISEAAYFRAQKRGFQPGHELDDWFAAEKEIAHLLVALAG